MNNEEFEEAIQMVENILNEEAKDAEVNQKILSINHFLLGLSIGIATIGILWGMSVGAF